MKKLSYNDKPTLRVVNARVPHGVTPNIVVAVYPDGTIGLRELRRRQEFRLNLGTLYTNALLADAREKAAAKRKNRRRG